MPPRRVNLSHSFLNASSGEVRVTKRQATLRGLKAFYWGFGKLEYSFERRPRKKEKKEKRNLTAEEEYLLGGGEGQPDDTYTETGPSRRRWRRPAEKERREKREARKRCVGCDREREWRRRSHGAERLSQRAEGLRDGSADLSFFQAEEFSSKSKNSPGSTNASSSPNASSIAASSISPFPLRASPTSQIPFHFHNQTDADASLAILQPKLRPNPVLPPTTTVCLPNICHCRVQTPVDRAVGAAREVLGEQLGDLLGPEARRRTRSSHQSGTRGTTSTRASTTAVGEVLPPGHPKCITHRDMGCGSCFVGYHMEQLSYCRPNICECGAVGLMPDWESPL